MDCYHENFVQGWVREVLVDNKRIVIGKVIADCEKAENAEHHQHHNKPRLHVLPREVLGIRPNLDYGLE